MQKTSISHNNLAFRALVCPEDRVRVIVRVTGHGNEGLKLFVESSGTKSWYFGARVNGSPPKDMPLGRWPDVSIAEARRRKADAVSSIARGDDPWARSKLKCNTLLAECWNDQYTHLSAAERTTMMIMLAEGDDQSAIALRLGRPVSSDLARPGGKYLLVRAQGDSMAEAGIADGSLVLVKQKEVAGTG